MEGMWKKCKCIHKIKILNTSKIKMQSKALKKGQQKTCLYINLVTEINGKNPKKGAK